MDARKWIQYPESAIRDGRYFKYSQSAKKTLVEDIIIPKICPLLGLKLSYEDFGIRYNSPFLDRKDPNNGYTKENIGVISSRANLLKNDASLAELELLVRSLKSCGYT